MKKQFFNHNLSSLLGLCEQRIITFIGGGGKTSLINTLGKEFARQNIPTLLTTTTHMMKPDFLPDESYIERENFEQLTTFFSNLQRQHGKLPLAALGIPSKMENEKVKWRSPSTDFCKAVAHFSLESSHESLKILCEGDGSKRLPVKIPKEGEPVFFPKTDTVIGVIGLSCLKKTIKETLFRYELLEELLSTKRNTEITDNSYNPHEIMDTHEPLFSKNNFIKSLQPTDTITTDFLYWLCLSEKGLRKNITSEKFCIILNQADILDEKTLLEVISLRNEIRNAGIDCHILSLKDHYIIVNS